MVNINGKQYNLCLFDTNALSNLLINTKAWINYFDKYYSLTNTLICYSAFTLSELWFRKELFEKYLDFFTVFPSAILDGYETIFQKEVDNYYQNGSINPIVVVPFAINDPNLTPKERLQKVISDSGFIKKTNYWKDGQLSVLEGMLDLKKNYPPENEKYTIKEIEFFNFTASTQQIGLRDMTFAKTILASGQSIDLNRFPSIKTTSYIVFYKFYTDQRKASPSDVFDIIISSLLPYVDIFITEGNMCDIIKNIQKRHDFLTNINLASIKDVNKDINSFA